EGARDERRGARGLHEARHAQAGEERGAAARDAARQDAAQVGAEDAQHGAAHDVRAPHEEGHAGEEVEERLHFGFRFFKASFNSMAAQRARARLRPEHLSSRKPEEAHPDDPRNSARPRRCRAVIGVAFDGLAYGSLLFLVSLGLSVQMGLMNFVNLAHGAFAMAGGFICVVAMSRFGVPFLAALPLAFVLTAAVGAVMERLLYRRLYGASHLDQVLFSIGLTFMAIAGATWIFGASQQPVRLPAFLRGQVHAAGIDFGV